MASFFKSVDQFSKMLEQTNKEELLDNLKDLDGIGETQIISIKIFSAIIKMLKLLKI